MEGTETVANEIADVIETAIEDANASAEQAVEVHEALVDAAMEGERSRRISELERRIDEWQNNQEMSNQAIAALSLGMERLTGQLEVLLTQAQFQTPTPQSEREDGPKESQEETPPATEASAVEPPPPPAPAPAPRKKRFHLI